MKNEYKPLTLEQLREMRENTEIIGPSVLISWNGVMAYGVLDEHTDDGICDVVGVGVWLKEKDYGKTWVAYAYQPARIDREKWGPCEHCKPCANPFDIWGPHTFPIDGNEMYFYDTDYGWEGEEIKFCPWCGRPLTEEAWAELERRVLGE